METKTGFSVFSRIVMVGIFVIYLLGGTSMSYDNILCERLTAEMGKYLDDWTEQKSILLLKEAEMSDELTKPFGVFPTNIVSVKTIGRGKVILINGKDISGNLGSKITHGDKSHIIDNISNSEINIDTQNNNVSSNVSNNKSHSVEKTETSEETRSFLSMDNPVVFVVASLIVGILIAIVLRRLGI